MANLDDAQLADYKSDIEANTDAAVIAALAAGNHALISDWYNEESLPEVWLLRQDVTPDQIIAAADWAGEYTDRAEVTIGATSSILENGFKASIGALSLLLAGEVYNASSEGARDALNTIFAGSPNTKAGILSISTRKGSFFEAIYRITATGPGGGDGSASASSAIAAVVGESTFVNVRDALLLP